LLNCYQQTAFVFDVSYIVVRATTTSTTATILQPLYKMTPSLELEDFVGA